jgi:Holliday junction resolvasome RuvABC endonuclease subunit
VGIDPGYRNLGWCVVETRNGTREVEILGRGTFGIKTSTQWVSQFEALLRQVAEWVLAPFSPVEAVGVELISWYGRRRGVLALAHLAGACAALGLAVSSRVRLFPAAQVKAASAHYPAPSEFTEHERDALALCRLLLAKTGRGT